MSFRLFMAILHSSAICVITYSIVARSSAIDVGRAPLSRARPLVRTPSTSPEEAKGRSLDGAPSGSRSHADRERKALVAVSLRPACRLRRPATAGRPSSSPALARIAGFDLGGHVRFGLEELSWRSRGPGRCAGRHRRTRSRTSRRCPALTPRSISSPILEMPWPYMMSNSTCGTAARPCS